MDFNFGMWALGAVIVVGLIQWVKGMFPKAPSWVWTAALPIVSFIAALAYGPDKIIWNVFGTWSVAQIGYEVILQSVKNKFVPPRLPETAVPPNAP
jgi:hypothetical protein